MGRILNVIDAFQAKQRDQVGGAAIPKVIMLSSTRPPIFMGGGDPLDADH